MLYHSSSFLMTLRGLLRDCEVFTNIRLKQRTSTQENLFFSFCSNSATLFKGCMIIMSSFQAVETTASGAGPGQRRPTSESWANCVIIANYSAAREGDGFKPLSLTNSANTKCCFRFQISI